LFETSFSTSELCTVNNLTCWYTTATE